MHRARLKTGEEVAVKIQYPGIARTIREDFRNLIPFLLPARLTKDWENTKDQFDDLRMRLEQETDYELEAANLEKARPLFREDDGIVVPRVYPTVLDVARADDGAARRRAHRRVSGSQPVAGGAQRVRPKNLPGLVPHDVRRPACCTPTFIRATFCSSTTAGWA